MPDRTLSARLGQLALALLNATLLLAVLLVFGLWLLAGRVQDFAAETARGAAGALGQDLAAEMAQASDALARLSALEGRIEATLERAAAGAEPGAAPAPVVAELQGLRGDVQALTRSLDGLQAAAAGLGAQGHEALLAALQAALQSLAEGLPPAPAAPSLSQPRLP